MRHAAILPVDAVDAYTRLIEEAQRQANMPDNACFYCASKSGEFTLNCCVRCGAFTCDGHTSADVGVPYFPMACTCHVCKGKEEAIAQLYADGIEEARIEARGGPA